MKPRLKLHFQGGVSVVTPSKLKWDQCDARRFLLLHYGSLQRAAEFFGVPNSVVGTATSYLKARLMAGQVAEVRQILGLSTAPTAQALVVAANFRKRRAMQGPDATFSSRSEARA